MSTKALFIACIIDANKGRDVATIDITDVFTQVDMEGEVDMKLEDTMGPIHKIGSQVIDQIGAHRKTEISIVHVPEESIA